MHHGPHYCNIKLNGALAAPITSTHEKFRRSLQASPRPAWAAHCRPLPPPLLQHLDLGLRHLTLGLSLNEFQGEPVGSVALAVRVLVRERIEEHVAQVAVAPGAEDLQGAGAVRARANVAARLFAVVALVEHRPTATGGEL